MSEQIIAQLACGLNLDHDDEMGTHESVLTGSAEDMGCTDTHTCHMMVDGVVIERTVDIDFNKLTAIELDEIMIYGVRKYIIDEEGLARYEEIVAKRDEDVLFDDPSPALYEDYGAESAWNDYLDIQEDMACVLKPIAYTDSLRLRILAFEMKAEGLKKGSKDKPGLQAKIKEADKKVQELDTILNNARTGKSARLSRAQWDAIVKGKNEWKARAEKLCGICHQLGDRLADMWDEVHNAEDVIGSQYRWDMWKILKAMAVAVQGEFSWFYPKFLEAADETISPWLTTGEVDPELDNFALHSEMLDVGANLAWQHLNDMEASYPGFLSYDDILAPNSKPGDEPRPRTGGYRPKTRVLDPVAFSKGVIQSANDKWARSMPEYSKEAEEDYIRSVMDGMDIVYFDEYSCDDCE